jgi:hypothetical protein
MLVQGQGLILSGFYFYTIKNLNLTSVEHLVISHNTESTTFSGHFLSF